MGEAARKRYWENFIIPGIPWLSRTDSGWFWHVIEFSTLKAAASSQGHDCRAL